MKSLIVYTNPGHAGIAIDDGKGNLETYNYGHVAALGNYVKASTSFNIAANIGLIAAAMTVYALGGMYAASELIPHTNEALTTTVGTICATYAAVVCPTKGILVEDAQYDYTEEGRNKVFKVAITDDQYNNIKKEISSYKKSLYSLGLSNCAGFARSIIKAAGIELSNKLINTPRSLEKEIRRHTRFITP